MPAPARIRSGFLIGAVLVAGTVLSLAPPPAASAAVVADPIYDDGACIVLPISDGGEGGAQCAGADLGGTRFGEADFRNAVLAGASFVDGDVQGAVFSGADLTGADFTGARIVGADFTGSSMLPATITVEADASGTAPVAIEPAAPAGLTVDGCSIVGVPVEAGQTFPIGTSSLLCTISSSFTGTASALVTVEVVASATATPTSEPLFTDEPADASDARGDAPDGLLIGLLVGGAVLLVAGIAAFVFANRRPKER
jgi:hypothetical protein